MRASKGTNASKNAPAAPHDSDLAADALAFEEDAISPVTGRSKYGRKTKRDRSPAGGERFGPRGEPLKPRGEGPAAAPASLFRKPSLDDMGPGTDTAVPAGHPRGEAVEPRGESPDDRHPRAPSRGSSDAAPSYFRKNSLDEMTVGRTEKPTGKTPPKKPAPTAKAPSSDASPSPETGSAGRDETRGSSQGGPGRGMRANPTNAGGKPTDPDSPAPIRRERIGRGSYEDPADQRRKRRPGKTGRPGQ